MISSEGDGEPLAADLNLGALCLLSACFSSFISAREHVIKPNYPVRLVVFWTFFFLLDILKFYFIFNWRIIMPQYCDGFYHTST